MRTGRFSHGWPPAAVLLFTVVVIATASAGAATASPDPSGLEQQALAAAAQAAGLPESELTLLDSASATFAAQGVTVYDFKIAHEESGTIYQVTLDADGGEHDLETLAAQEEQLRYDQYGALNADFHGRLVSAPPDEVFPVVLWVREPFEDPAVLRADPLSQPTEADVNNQAAANDEVRQQAVAAAVAPVVDQLAALGYSAATDELTPAVATDLPADLILQEVSRWPEVLEVADASGLYEPTLEVQLPACQTNPVHNQGITGAGVPVAVVEVGGRINTANPFLTPVTQDLPFSCTAAHAAAVAGIVRSTNTARLGHAYASPLWIGGSCGGVLNELINRSNAAAGWGARTFNLSFGAPWAGGVLTALDRYYDSLVLNGWRTVVPAAGNTGTAGFVNSPGTAYNVVTVGSFDDRNTTFWPDDVMSTFSSTLNPGSWMGDRIKPEVAAPGSNLNSTTNASPWTGPVGSGTSYAAPAVTGISALLMQRSWALRIWPESVKAILMASAEHNIEGAARLSNRDGAGGVVADRADRVARRVPGFGNWSGIFYGCGNPNLQNLTTVNLTAGQRIRFAMAWDTNPNYALYASRPGADLDLWARTPGGGFAAFSVSWDNTYEIVDFTAPVSGPYTFQVNKFRCSSHPYWLGWAWHVVP